MRRLFCVFAAAVTLGALCCPLPSSAREVAGLTVPERAEAGGKVLVLNGAGIRKKFFVKVYVGALYLTERRVDAAGVLGLEGPKRIEMRFLRGVKADSIAESWNNGFEANLSEEERNGLGREIDAFIGLFVDMSEGDICRLDLLPGEGTVVSLNGKILGKVGNENLFGALLGVWLGPRPADRDLKESLLGR